MKRIKCLVLAAVLLGSYAPIGISGQDAPKPKVAEEKAKPSMIRKDLLRTGPSQPGMPKRNIFSPRSSFAAQLTPPPTPLGGPTPPGSQVEIIPAEGEGQAPPSVSINLRYIGYIESPRKMIALIILEGEAVAVAEGEIIGDGLTIGKITSLEIEIVLPDSTTRKFSLEKGE